MKKQTVMDFGAMLFALVTLVVITVLLPSFWPLWMKSLIGALVAFILFVIYLAARKPDKVIALERQLENIAINASKIKDAGNNLIPEARAFSENLIEVSTEIAKLAVKILHRELPPLDNEIRRLETLSESFLTLTTRFTGEVYLRPNELQVKLTDFRNQQQPEAMATLEEINVSVDENKAKQLAQAEQELEFLNELYASNSAALNAAQILKQILETTESSS